MSATRLFPSLLTERYWSESRDATSYEWAARLAGNAARYTGRIGTTYRQSHPRVEKVYAHPVASKSKKRQGWGNRDFKSGKVGPAPERPVCPVI